MNKLQVASKWLGKLSANPKAELDKMEIVIRIESYTIKYVHCGSVLFSYLVLFWFYVRETSVIVINKWILEML